jgi:meso-butanediol dehydrogenase/(S,S)-butanediol dehydrogenase/diacetyl reductase
MLTSLVKGELMTAGEFTGKVAVITGAGSGIGEATAKLFAANGAAVVVADINSAAASRVRTEIVGAGHEAVARAVDVCDPDGMRDLMELATATYGRLDILHNNAASTVPGRLADLTVEAWRGTLEACLTSVWLGTKFAVPHMIRAGAGAIVNMGSVGGLAADEGLGAYGASKAGVISLTRTTAIEYGRQGVRANCVCPGTTASPPLKAALEHAGRSEAERAASRQRMLDANALGCFAEPVDIAEIVLFLASPRSRFMTGSVVLADGGLLAHTGLPRLVPLQTDVRRSTT